jgi:hypothetical protein
VTPPGLKNTEEEGRDGTDGLLAVWVEVGVEVEVDETGAGSVSGDTEVTVESAGCCC